MSIYTLILYCTFKQRREDRVRSTALSLSTARKVQPLKALHLDSAFLSARLRQIKRDPFSRHWKWHTPDSISGENQPR